LDTKRPTSELPKNRIVPGTGATALKKKNGIAEMMPAKTSLKRRRNANTVRANLKADRPVGRILSQPLIVVNQGNQRF
jgi:hypothetical protein